MKTMELAVPSLAEAAADALRQLIVSGQLRPNDRVRERDFAQRLGVSRTPLRAAMQQLQGEGFVTGNPRKGVLVSPLSVEEITGSYQLLAALERASLLHTPGVSSEMLRRLRTASRIRNSGTNDVERLRMADLEWHRALTDYTSNRSLRAMLQAPRRMIERYERAFFRNGEEVELSTKQHDEIESAVKRGQLEEAADLVEAHWLGNIPAMAEIIERSGAGA